MIGNRATAILGVLIAACALLLPSACSPSAPTSSTAPSTAVAASVASPKEILADLAKWDAATTADRRAAAEGVARRLPDFALLRLETFSCGGQTHEVAVYRHAKTEMEFVLLPGGTFVMGSPESDPGRYDNEGPQHAVRIARPYLVARTECTQAAYERIVGASPSAAKGADHPVESVSWDDAQEFCRRSDLRLPSEAEWEFACRAGTTTAYWSGDTEEDLKRVGSYRANSSPAARATPSEVGGSPSPQGHQPVAQRPSNPFGLFDVHGNVEEWCEDRWHDSYLGAPVDGRVWIEDVPGARVFRGGSWFDPPWCARSASRNNRGQAYGFVVVGFRPAKTVPTE